MPWHAGMRRVVVAKPEQGIMAFLPVGKRRDPDQNIQDRLGAHAADRRRAVVLDAMRHGTQGIPQTVPFLGKGGAVAQMKLAHQTTGLARLLAIEKRTTTRVG